jgi:serine/threonine protein kinase
VVDSRIRPYPLHERRADISRRLEDVVMKCLSKNPLERYPSMSLVRRDLDALL